MEPWWPRAGDDPGAFRDPASVASLIDGALLSDPDARAAAAGALSSVVKALEDDPVEESMRLLAQRMPELVRGLADPDSSTAVRLSASPAASPSTRAPSTRCWR